MEGGPSVSGPNIQEREGIVNSSSNEVETASGWSYSFCDPRGKLHRFIALLFMCLLGFGSYFCYDNPGALQNELKKELNLTTTQYSLFYSMYSWPNVILCFVGGFLIDRFFGIRLGTNIYMALTLIGQVLFATGVMFNVFWVMLMGRFIFGIGGESLAVAQNNYAVLWFKGKELNMVFGLQMSIARVGSTVNFIVMETVYNWVDQSYHGAQGLGIVLFVATTTCILSMFCALVLGVLDKRAERILRRQETSSSEVVRLRDVIDFKITFWLISIICVTYYVAIFPFIAVAKGFFTTKFKMSDYNANLVISILYSLAAVVSPIIGLLVDKLGKNILWILLAISVTIGSHVLLGFTNVVPYVGVVFLSLSYSCLASSLWPLVSLIVPEYQLGTAYGVCQAIQNLGLAVFTILTGVVVDHYGYTGLEIFFINCLAVALLMAVLLWVLDMWQGGVLNMTPGERRQHQHSLLIEDEDKEPFLNGEEGTSNEGEGLQPSTDFEIRNRYLSRIGAPVSGEEA